MVSNYKDVSIDLIEVNPNNQRKYYNEKSINELAENLIKIGLIEPLVVRAINGKYELVCGHRRYLAARKANLKVLSCNVQAYDDDQVFDIMISENLQREDLSPMDEAQAFRLLIDKRKYSMDDVAANFSKSVEYVFGRLRLLSLCELGKEKLQNNILPITAAIKISTLPERIQLECLKRLIIPMTVRGVVTEVFSGLRDMKTYFDNDVLMSLSSADFNTEDEKLLPCGSCKMCPKRTGNSLFGDMAESDKCLDSECFHDKHVKHYQDLKLSISKKIKYEIVFAARRYNAEKSYKDLGDVISLTDYEAVEEKFAANKKNARYAIFVGIDPTNPKSTIQSGWILLKEKVMAKKEKSSKKLELKDKLSEQEAQVNEFKIQQRSLFDQLKKKKQDQFFNLSIAYACSMIWNDIYIIDTDIVLDIVRRYNLSMKSKIFNGKKWVEVTLDKKYVHEVESTFPSIDGRDLMMSIISLKDYNISLKILNEITFLSKLAGTTDVSEYKLDVSKSKTKTK